MKIECRNCKSKNLFVEIQGTRRGLYCGDCGKWQKWITKEELQICKFNNIKRHDKNIIDLIEVRRYAPYRRCSSRRYSLYNDRKIFKANKRRYK